MSPESNASDKQSSQGKIADAFEAVQRRDFLPGDQQQLSGLDQPLPIGFGQTSSQPYTVGFMLQLLDVQPGQKILDVGSGSGWTAALLAYLTGTSGQVIGVERIPELVVFAKSNLKKQSYKNITIHEAGKIYGWAGEAPYDRILVSAGAIDIPDELLEQLTDNGVLVIPVGESILRVKKIGQRLDVQEYPGFMFVPLLPAG